MGRGGGGSSSEGAPAPAAEAPSNGEASENPVELELLEPRYAPPREAINAAGAVPVKALAHVMSLSGIDSKEQCFEVELFLQLEWFVGLPPQEVGDATTAWKPRPHWTGISKEYGADVNSNFRVVADGVGSRVLLSYTVHAVFRHRFELHAFPFDRQTLQIPIIFWHSPLERVVSPARDGAPERCRLFRGRLAFEFGRHRFYRDRFVQSDVWKCDWRNAVTVRAGHTNEEDRSAEDGQRFSMLTVEITIDRKKTFYVWNVLMLFDIFVIMSFMSFGCDVPSSLTDRATITLNMVLTAAAFKISISSHTPQIGYLTYLDVFQLLAFVVLGLVCIQNVIVCQIFIPENARRFNTVSGVIIASLWAAVHALLPILHRVAKRHSEERTRRLDAQAVADSKRWRLTSDPTFRMTLPQRVSSGWGFGAEVAAARQRINTDDV